MIILEAPVSVSLCLAGMAAVRVGRHEYGRAPGVEHHADDRLAFAGKRLLVITAEEGSIVIHA